MASCGISYPAFHSDLVPDDNERAGSLLLDPRHRGDGGRRRTAHCHYPTNWESKSFCQLSVRATDEAKRHQRWPALGYRRLPCWAWWSTEIVLVLFGWGTGLKNTVSVSHKQCFSGGWMEVQRARGCQLIYAAGESEPLALSICCHSLCDCNKETSYTQTLGLLLCKCALRLSTHLNCVELIYRPVAENVL